MADRLVVGIFPTCDPQELRTAVAAQPGIDVNKLRVVTYDTRTDEHVDSGLHFVHVIDDESLLEGDERLTHGTGIITDFGGTDVPGINWGNNLSSFYTGDAANLLGDLGIPDDEAENFSEAIDENRCVAVYNAGDNPEAAAAALKTAGLKNVHSF